MFRNKILIASFFGFYFAIVILLSQDNQEWLHGLNEAAAEKMPYQLRQLFALVLVYSLSTRVDKGAVENIHREDEVRARMAEYKTLKYVANYLASNGKTLEVYGLSEINTYSDVSTEVDGPATESIAQQEVNAYSPTDLEHGTGRPIKP
ncbi:Helitron helicase [Phytophthora megakarya]|uniref:Helitron helicase n=1 Tax=Phytophthora megakarya TaxID=4795 RepID=A0A225V7V8_9STRA|nr:Helitron helicase [Phytophthora megakarya]